MEPRYNSKKMNFLYDAFNIVNLETVEVPLNLDTGKKDFTKDYRVWSTNAVLVDNGFIIAIKKNDSSQISFTKEAFEFICDSDKTKNKVYSQWLLTMLTRMTKKQEFDKVVKIISEDLPNINDNLQIFDSLKKTKRFKVTTNGIIGLSHIKDKSDILQYNEPEELYDAIYPFLGVTMGALEASLISVVNNKEGEILVNDAKFMVFKPLTTEASVTFSNYATWCTAREGNGMFKHYTSMKRPNGSDSELYILIKKEGPDLMQIHFESNQFCDSRNTNNKVKLINEFINESNGVRTFLKNELVNLVIESANSKKYSKMNNYYLSNIQDFGFFDKVINMFKDDTEVIDYKSLMFTKDVEFKYFKQLKVFSLVSSKLNTFPLMKYSKSLEIFSLYDNLITEIPLDLCNAKHMKSINLGLNNISYIPSEIANLDPSNGGSLINLSLKGNPLNEKEKNKLKEYLPNVYITL